MTELNPEGFKAAEAILFNQIGSLPEGTTREDTPDVTREVLRAYFDNAEIEGRIKLRAGAGKGVVQGSTHKFSVGGTEGYLTVNCFPDGRPGEIFLHGIGKDGSTVTGLMNWGAILFSVALQYGVPMEVMTQFMRGMDFEPKGETNNEEIPQASSLPDYLAQYLEAKYGQDAT